MAIFTDEMQPKARRVLLSEDIDGRSAKDIIEKIIEKMDSHENKITKETSERIEKIC